MKYLVRLLTVIPRFVTIGALVLLPLLGTAAPAYAFSPFNQFAGTGPITCANGPSFSTTTTATHSGGGEACFVTLYIDPAVKILSGLVGVFVVLSIVIAGIQYSSAADDSSKVAAAKGRITKALIALLAYLFLLAFVKYLLPGGI